MLEQLRADAWRFDYPDDVEGMFRALIAAAPRVFSVYELNVLYELICFAPTVIEMLRVQDGERPSASNLAGTVADWQAMAGRIRDHRPMTISDVPRMPFQLILCVGALASGMMSGAEVIETVEGWRISTRELRRAWPSWAAPDVMPSLIATTIARGDRDLESRMSKLKERATRPVLTLSCEALMRINWLFECEAADAISFGPVSDRRLPRDAALAAVTLRRFCEQQPELRKTPAFVHVATVGTTWMRPRDYAMLRVPAADDEQTAKVAHDAIVNRRYMHDHVAVIEVDRKPWKMIVLAPEYHHKVTGTTYLEAILVHEKGAFTAEVMLRGGDTLESLVLGLILPFGSHAWRSLAEPPPEDAPQLPPDGAVTSLIIAAWRDLVVANVREQQYVSTVEREADSKPTRRAERKSKRGHVRVVRYLPRMVVIRREEEAERAEHGKRGPMRRAYRVGTFAKRLREGHKRSQEASEFAEEIGMPLKDNQTVVRPHIRGGTEEEREALLAQDDVRLWRSWAAVDLIFATGQA